MENHSMDKGKLIIENEKPKVEESASHYQLSTLNSPLVKARYKQTEVGVIPEDWECKPLSFSCSMKSGETITSSFISNDYKYPCYGGNGLRGFTEKFTHDGSYALIGRQGALCGNIVGVFNKFFASEHAIVVTPFDNIDIRWLTFVLVRMNLNKYSESSAQPGLSVNKLLPLKVATPKDKKEQKAIAKALSGVDALIEAQEKLIAKKQAIKTATMQQLLTGQKRLSGFGEGKGTQQTELGEIPEDWEVVKFDEIGRGIIGLTYSPSDVVESGTLVLRSSNVQNNRLAFNNNVYVNMELPSRVIVEENDILVCVRNGSRNLIGKCALIDKDTSGNAFGAFMSIFRAESPVFVFYQFQSNIIQTQINEIMGATINQITNKDMAGFQIPYPKDKKERESIGCLLADFDSEIDSLEAKLKKTKSIKQGMMQELLTGKTRLIENG